MINPPINISNMTNNIPQIVNVTTKVVEKSKN